MFTMLLSRITKYQDLSFEEKNKYIRTKRIVLSVYSNPPTAFNVNILDPLTNQKSSQNNAFITSKKSFDDKKENGSTANDLADSGLNYSDNDNTIPIKYGNKPKKQFFWYRGVGLLIFLSIAIPLICLIYDQKQFFYKIIKKLKVNKQTNS